MITASGEFAQTIDGQDMRVAYRVVLALPIVDYHDISLALESITLESDTTTDLPANTRLQSGYATDSATFVASGLVDPTDETKTAAWLFGAYRTDSPLWRKRRLRCPVTIFAGVYPDGGLGPELLQVFTGRVDDVAVAKDGTVTFTCLDLNCILDPIPALAAVITAPPYNASITSEFAMDYVLRRATNGAISSWPAQRADCVLAVGMRSSVWPEVGQMDVSSGFPIPVFVPGFNGTALQLPSVTPAHYKIPAVGAALFVEFGVTGGTSGHGATQVFVEDGTGLEGVFVSTSSAGVSVASITGDEFDYPFPGGDTGGAGYYVGVAFTLPASGGSDISGVLSLADGDHPFTFAVGTRALSWSTVSIITADDGSISGLQVSTETTPTSNAQFVPQAVLDPSLNPLTVIPPISAGSAGGVLQAMAEAELGVARFDNMGVFRFLNRNTLRSGGAVRTLTSETSLDSLAIEETASEICNDATVPYVEWSFAPPATVWSLTTVKQIPRGTTTFSVTLDNPAGAVPLTVAALPDTTPTPGLNYFRASADPSGATEFTGPLTFTITQVTSTTISISVSNPAGAPAYLVSSSAHTDLPAGTPCLQIGGITATPSDEMSVNWQYPPVAAGGAMSSVWGDQPTSFGSSDWIQDHDTALLLAQDIVIDGYAARVNFTNMECVPDPRLVVTDRVFVKDSAITQANELATIFSRSITYQPGQNSMTVDARSVAAPGGILLGIPGRCETGDPAFIYG